MACVGVFVPGSFICFFFLLFGFHSLNWLLRIVFIRTSVWPHLVSHTAFVFEELEPSAGREGEMCSCSLRFGKIDKDINIGFGLLFGAAVPAFEEDMQTEVDHVRIKFKIPPRVCFTSDDAPRPLTHRCVPE